MKTDRFFISGYKKEKLTLWQRFMLISMEELRQLSKDQIVMGFVASCIEDVANRLGVDYTVVYKRMNSVGMIDKYLIPFYNTLHTESRETLTDSLIESLNRWEAQR